MAGSGLTIDAGDNTVVCGRYISQGRYEGGVVKYSPSGAVLWQQILTAGSENVQGMSAVVTDASGSIYVVGRLPDAAGRPNAALAKLDSAGNVLWTRTDHGTAPIPNDTVEEFTRVAFAPNGNVRVAGVTTNTVTGRDILVAEYTPLGALVWRATWDGPTHFIDSLLNLNAETDGSTTLLGSAIDALSARRNAVIARWSASGEFRGATLIPIPAALNSTLLAGAFGSGGTRIFAGHTSAGSVTTTDILVIGTRAQGRALCSGDGSATPCPCGVGSNGNGCPNSVYSSGAVVFASGDASIASDSLLLQAEGMASGAALFLQGTALVNGGTGSVFGDGLQCASGTMVRLATKQTVNGASKFPDVGDALVSVQGGVTSAGLRTYQVIYRNNVTFCTPSGFNATNGLAVTWAP